MQILIIVRGARCEGGAEMIDQKYMKEILYLGCNATLKDIHNHYQLQLMQLHTIESPMQVKKVIFRQFENIRPAAVDNDLVRRETISSFEEN